MQIVYSPIRKLRGWMILFISLVGVTDYCSAQSDWPLAVSDYHYEVIYNGFIVDYDTAQFIPFFSYYHIVGSELLSDLSRGRFFADYSVPNTSLPSDYSYSGYDRGHMCPVASCISNGQKSDCMSMVNIAPQLPTLNRGFWKRLENFERCNSVPDAYVISGCTLTLNKDTIRLNNKVAVPHYFYKIIYNLEKGVIAFLIDYEGLEHSTINDAVIPLDSLEMILKIDFFPELSNSITEINLTEWEF